MLPILELRDPQKRKGRPRTDQRRIIDGLIFKVRTGCQWNLIPRVYGSDTTLYRTARKWCSLGVWPILWALIVGESPELAQWDWTHHLLEKTKRRNSGRPPSMPKA